MKKILITLAAVLAVTLAPMSLSAENTNTNAGGKPATEQVQKTKDQSTGRTWKGHEVFRGPKGGLYYWHTPKTGKNAGTPTKRYLSKEERDQFDAGSDGTNK